MIIKDKQNISLISWLSSNIGGGYAEKFYEPETIEELQELCEKLYAQNLTFDLIGHTSNTLYTSDYNVERMVSTRKLNRFEIKENCIFCECGTSVKSLAKQATEQGIKGFEGLIDLPGTVAAALYGNAGCYHCSISELLISAKILLADGKVIDANRDWFDFRPRSSVLKRKEKQGVILSALLKKECGDNEQIKRKAEENHNIRRNTQPEAKNSLGSIFSDAGRPTLLNRTLSLLTKPYDIILKLSGRNKEERNQKRKYLIFSLLGAKDVEPYVRSWNWYQWKDPLSHKLFWKYVRLHKRMFTKSVFEIEIKRKT